MRCAAEDCSDRVIRPLFSAVKTNIEYLAIHKSGKKQDVGRRMTFERFLDFLFADFFEGLHFGHYPKQCGICKRYFLRKDDRNQQYCDGIDPTDPKKRPCRRVAADVGRKTREKGKDHPIKIKCATRLNTIARKACDRYKLNSRFEDVKQVIIEAILKKLPDYDLSAGTTLLQYVKPYIHEAIHYYIRRYGSAAFSLNSNEYRQLRRVNARQPWAG